MLINQVLEKQHMTRYRLSKESGVPQATINDICNGKTDLERCTAGTLYKIAKVLGITVEAILESVSSIYRCSFETFKSNICHRLKDNGDIDFVLNLLETDEIRDYYNCSWYPEALYLLAMLDYLSRINEVPICTRYNDIRAQKLAKPLYPAGVLLAGKVLNSDHPLKEAREHAIPEFLRFNIIESEVRNVI